MTRKWHTTESMDFVDAIDFGAFGDGVTQSASGINSAISDAAGHRAVRLRTGTFLLNADLVPVANTVIQGAGMGETILKLTGTNRGFAITNIPGVTLRDLTIDCNKASTTDNGTSTQHGIHLTATNSTGCPRTRLERVKIMNAWDRGFNAQATTLDTHPLEVDLIDCVITGCTSQGAFISNSTKTRVTRGEYASNLYGLQVVGGRNAIIDGARAWGNSDHGIVANTAITGANIVNNECFSNGVSANKWAIVVGIDARQFVVSGNRCYDNVGGITIDVANTVSAFNPIDTRGVVSDNVCTRSTLSDGIHVNQADGLSITGNHTAYNAQDGISIYGRNCIVTGNISHHNGRDGINFEEDLTPPLVSCGPHIYGPNLVYANNTSAGAFKDFYVATLTNGGVLDTSRMADALPLDVPAGQFVQLNPSPMTTSVMLDGQSYSLPFDIVEPQAFDQLLFEVVTTPGSAGSVCRGAIFYDDGTGRRPGRRREDLGTIATTATGVKALTITNTAFSVGRYWADIVPQGTPATNPTLRVVTSPHIRVATTALATLAQEFLMTTGITGAFADPHPTVNSTNTIAISMALRAA